jgi:hypothetical protein
MIVIDGKSYRVVETLAFHQMGMSAKVVDVDGKEKVAVKEGRRWRFWRAKDRLQPPAQRPRGMGAS